MIYRIKKIFSRKRDILGRSKYLNSSVLIPIVKLNGEFNLLFQVRAKNIRQGSDICFPGGKFDNNLDKNYIDTAIRECYEEIGVESNKVKILGSMNILIAVIGVIIEPVIALLKIKSINELIINKDEVESVFTLPISYFYTNRPEEYYLRVEILPKITNENGENITLLPVKELGISSYYENPWGHNKHKVYVYKTPYGTIWGITAEIIHELINSIY